MGWNRFIDTLLGLFFLLSLFYLVKNVFFSPNGYQKIKEYRESIENLRALIEKEKAENTRLKEEYTFILNHRSLALKYFTQEYLWLIPPDVAVFLSENRTAAGTTR